MSAKIWLGFGGCKFEANGIEATFSGASGKVGFDPDQKIVKNVNRNYRSKLNGYDVDVETNEMYNVTDTDYLEYVELSKILTYLVNTSSNSQKYVTITPRYDTGLTTNLTYNCILKSKVKPGDISRCKTGQVLGLKWLENKQSIPDFTSDSEAGYLVDESGNNCVDESANKVIDGLG
jgi:hypothetical protein